VCVRSISRTRRDQKNTSLRVSRIRLKVLENSAFAASVHHCAMLSRDSSMT
jgi:hypothetical protein